MENIIEEIRKERERQNNLWGVQEHSLSKFMSILLEEVGESAKEANDYEAIIDRTADCCYPLDEISKKQHLINCQTELIQVAAVAVQICERIESILYPNVAHLYSATLSHDNGSTEIKVYATDIESAIQSIIKAEKCPRTAISNVKLVNYGKSL